MAGQLFVMCKQDIALRQAAGRCMPTLGAGCAVLLRGRLFGMNCGSGVGRDELSVWAGLLSWKTC